jgi:biotin carboxyl carrier protein
VHASTTELSTSAMMRIVRDMSTRSMFAARIARRRMRAPSFATNSSRVLALAILSTALALAACKPSTEPGDRESQLTPASKNTAPERGPHGEVIVHLPKEAQEKMGLALATPVPHAMVSELVAYGRATPDPSAAFVVRAPIAGALIADAKANAWPKIGDELASGAVLGVIKPRLTAVERADVATRLAAARGDLAASRAALKAEKAALERMRALNAENKNVSDRALEEADARVNTEEARAAAASASIETLQALLEPGAESAASIAITLGKAGSVVEVLAHPGEAVDAGAVLVRLDDFDRLQARVEMPVEAESRVAAETIRIAAVGDDEHFFVARRIGAAASVDVANQGGTIVYAIDQAAPSSSGSSLARRLRPGQAIVARIPKSDAPAPGFLVPRSAVLRFGGKTWIYDATGDEDFMRREIALDAPAEQGWFVTAPWAANAHVVVTGAGELLSEEILGTQNKHAEEP